MPLREQDAAVSAFMLRVLEAVHQVGDAAETACDAEERGPATVVVRMGVIC